MSNGITQGNIYGIYGASTASIAPTALAANTAGEQSFTVPGVKLMDQIVSVTPPSNVANLGPISGRVTAADTVALKFTNPSAGSVTPPPGSYVLNINRYVLTSAGGIRNGIGD